MRFLCETSEGANLFIMRSYVNALNALGHTVFFWDSSQKSCDDAFDEFGEFDVYFGHTWRLNRASVRNLIARPNTKVILRANHYGELDDKIDLKQYPIGITTDEEKRFVEQLKKNHPNFNHMTCQYSQNEMVRSQTHNRWSNLGLDVRGILLCADVIDYYYTRPSKDYECDVVFAGGYWPYKAKYLSWVYGLCYPNAILKTRISGNGWSTPSCIGIASEHALRNLYSSAKVCPNLYEPHAIEVYSDLNQRLFQTSICGSFQISQKAIGIEEVFPDNEIILVESREEFYEAVVNFIQNPDERLSYIKKAVKRIYSDHTNFHRTAEVLNLLGYQEEAYRSLVLAREAYEHVRKDVEEIENV